MVDIEGKEQEEEQLLEIREPGHDNTEKNKDEMNSSSDRSDKDDGKLSEEWLSGSDKGEDIEELNIHELCQSNAGESTITITTTTTSTTSTTTTTTTTTTTITITTTTRVNKNELKAGSRIPNSNLPQEIKYIKIMVNLISLNKKEKKLDSIEQLQSIMVLKN
ncbi:hypothetical protein ACTA71_010922 [Dictyostelium dimigraforme]